LGNRIKILLKTADNIVHSIGPVAISPKQKPGEVALNCLRKNRTFNTMTNAQQKVVVVVDFINNDKQKNARYKKISRNNWPSLDLLLKYHQSLVTELMCHYRLTHRFAEIALLNLRCGKNKEVAAEINLEVDTVRKNNKAISKQLNVKTIKQQRPIVAGFALAILQQLHSSQQV
jgi:DNA-binding NarL/FixJ family response regulator